MPKNRRIKLKLWRVSLEGFVAKARQKEDDLALPRLEEDDKRPLNFSENAIFVNDNHGIWSCQLFKDANVDKR